MKLTQLINNFNNNVFIHKKIIKIFSICFMSTIILYCLIEILKPSQNQISNNEIILPPNWQKIELSLLSNYIPYVGEKITLMTTQGGILIKQGIFLGSKNEVNTFSENSRENLVKAFIGVQSLSVAQWKLIHLINPDNIFLLPYMDKNIDHQRKNYEIFY